MHHDESANTPGAREQICPLCQHRFNIDELRCPHGCPIASHCDVVCCPNCGYESVDSTRMERRLRALKDLWRRLTGRGGGPAAGTAVRQGGDRPSPGVLLSRLRPGDLCEILMIRKGAGERLDRLGTYGVVAGSTIRLKQKRPAYVIQIGQTDLALDEDLARAILVRRIEG
jgi:Fe2+ transport system protein FeoA